ncbi:MULTISPECIES: exotoxin OB-fold domain-containing protein [Staphylococcus]|uniref:exotoxin OB-fold domain-containing protein n=1 Tax=Staphylococcus agnetis TaxID=985762 RepID=UPI00338D6140
MLNLRNFYGGYTFEDHKRIDSLNEPWSHELAFNLENYRLKTNLESESNVAKLREKKVAIFSISYTEVGGTKYMYGGLLMQKIIKEILERYL